MIDNKLVIKKLQRLEEMFVIFSKHTNMPYVECDPETYDDLAYVMATVSDAQAFIKEYEEKKIALDAKRVPKNEIPLMLTSLFGVGANAIVFKNNTTTSTIQLEDIVKKPDMEKLMANPVPLMNSAFTLSALYFLEELYRPIEHDKQRLKELEEEMIANLVRAKYILGMTAADPKEKLDPQNPNQPKRINYVKDKEGRILLPVFSDTAEFRKFYKEHVNEIGMAVVPFEKLTQNIIPDAKGVVVNPASYHLHVMNDQLQKIAAAYCK